MTTPPRTFATRPPRLRLGDTIGVCAPAGPVLARRLGPGLALLGQHFAIRLGPLVAAAMANPDRAPGRPDQQAGYLAGDDAARAAELNALLRDPDVRAIIVARGGYGLTRLLPALDGAALAADPKPLIGFSDATALLAWALHHGVCGIHGPVVTQLATLPAEDGAALIAALTRAEPGPPWQALTQVGLDASARPGLLAGPLIPGNLIVTCSLVGTPWQLPGLDVIGLLEEVGERPYAIDRCLTQLALAGRLRWHGAVVGDLTRCTDPPHVAGATDDPAPAHVVVSERLAAAGVPGLAGAPVGHGARNRAVPFAGQVALDLRRGQLEFLDAAVA